MIKNKHNKNIPYGVIWANTINLGDDVQTLAAINFLEKKGLKAEVFVNREELINYSGPEINLIMNGWFMHDVHKFPPPEKINPIFISFHCSNEDLIKNNVEYFKKHDPIGCRDAATVELFRKNDINAYFTGCLTLYFNKQTVRNNSKYLVDINTCKYIPKVNLDKSEYKDYTELTHDLLPHEDRNNLNYRLEKTRSLLDRYSKASLVITTRLHAALPCRAFGTPVKFIHSDLNDPRFSGLTSILAGSSNINHSRQDIDPEIINDIITGFDLIDLS